VKALCGALFVVIASLILLFVNPLEQLAWLRCPVNLTTGLYCPGCGSLRAIHALLNGDLLSALSYNLLTVAVLPVLLVVGIQSLLRALQGRSSTIQVRPLVAWSVFGIVIVFTILRNLPFDSLRCLHP
jgi:hypothetical protein